MYVCMNECTYIHNRYVHIHTYVHTVRMCKHAHMHIYICMHACIRNTQLAISM